MSRALFLASILALIASPLPVVADNHEPPPMAPPFEDLVGFQACAEVAGEQVCGVFVITAAAGAASVVAVYLIPSVVGIVMERGCQDAGNVFRPVEPEEYPNYAGQWGCFPS